MSKETPQYLLLGQLRREFLITAQEKVYLDQPGGNLLYAAEGLNLWLDEDETAGLLARVGENYPRKWIRDLQTNGFNVDGIKILPQEIDHRRMIAYTALRERTYEEPIKHFSRLGITVPKALLSYKNQPEYQDDLTQLLPTTLRQLDFPEYYDYVSAAHLAPMDYMTHSLLPATLREKQVGTITLDPGPAYMRAENFNQVMSLITGLTAFMPSETEALSLFQGRTDDLWEIAEFIGGLNCDFVVITQGSGGQLLYVSATKEKFDVPAYPSRLVDITGAGDAFAGGFLAGFRKTYDPLQAVMYGNVSASLTVEGSGAGFLRETLPGLLLARLETLREMVIKV